MIGGRGSSLNQPPNCLIEFGLLVPLVDLEKSNVVAVV